MIAAHSLELRLSGLLLARRAKQVKANLKVERDDITRQTLGLLISNFIKEFSPPERLADELDNMLYLKNLLTHRISFKILSSAKYHDLWEEKICRELHDITDYMNDAADALQPYIDSCISKFCLEYERVMEKQIKQYPALRKKG